MGKEIHKRYNRATHTILEVDALDRNSYSETLKLYKMEARLEISAVLWKRPVVVRLHDALYKETVYLVENLQLPPNS